MIMEIIPGTVLIGDNQASNMAPTGCASAKPTTVHDDDSTSDGMDQGIVLNR